MSHSTHECSDPRKWVSWWSLPLILNVLCSLILTILLVCSCSISRWLWDEKSGPLYFSNGTRKSERKLGLMSRHRKQCLLLFLLGTMKLYFIARVVPLFMHFRQLNANKLQCCMVLQKILVVSGYVPPLLPQNLFFWHKWNEHLLPKETAKQGHVPRPKKLNPRFSFGFFILTMGGWGVFHLKKHCPRQYR